MKNALFLLALLAAGGIVGLFQTAGAQSLEIPPQLAPGVIMQHYYQDLKYRLNQPWLYQPVTEQDVAPVEIQSLIEIRQPNVSAKIVQPEEMTPVIRINRRIQ